MDTIIGTCSVCGGPVGMPRAFWSIRAPVPMCLNCGAEPVNRFGPVIPMAPRRPFPPRYEDRIDPFMEGLHGSHKS